MTDIGNPPDESRIVKYTFGGCEVDVIGRRLLCSGTMSMLEPQAFDLLLFLLQRRGAAVTKQEIFADIWNDRAVTEGVLTSRIRSIRRAIDPADGPSHIRTLHRVGYVFDTPVTAETSATPGADTPAPGGLPDTPIFRDEEIGVSGRSAIAVLPLNNFSDDRALGFLVDGLTEDLITLLARIPGFLVIARNSAFQYKGKSPDIREVGRTLGVDYVVEGSLRPVAGAIRVTVQLVETEGGNHVWARRFDCAAETFDTVQDDIVLEISRYLEPELTRAEVGRIAARPWRQDEIWSIYHQAAAVLNLQGWRYETFAESMRLFQQAIRLQPDFAPAHAHLALIYALGDCFRLLPESMDGDSLAVASAELALRLDNRSSLVLGYAGCALSDVGQIDRGISIMQRAVEDDPSNAQALVALGSALLKRGRARQGIEFLKRGIRISPLDSSLSFWGTNLASGLLRVRQLAEAEDQAKSACRRDDRNYLARLVLAAIQIQQQRASEARAAIEEARALRPDLLAADAFPLIGRRGAAALTATGLLG